MTDNIINLLDDSSDDDDDDDEVEVIGTRANSTVMDGVDSTAATAGGGSSPRRSGRDRVSTTMTINGHTVLRKNNYSVTADSYIFDDNGRDDENEEMTQKPAAVQQPRKKPSSTGPRVETAAEIARRTQKEAVYNVSSQKQYLQNHFLAKNVDILEPFCEETVISQLKEIRGTEHFKNSMNSTSQLLNKPVHVPSTIKATLRPYQKKGLDFLVRMHRQNVPAIIGDEMGL